MADATVGRFACKSIAHHEELAQELASVCRGDLQPGRPIGVEAEIGGIENPITRRRKRGGEKIIHPTKRHTRTAPRRARVMPERRRRGMLKLKRYSCGRQASLPIDKRLLGSSPSISCSYFCRHAQGRSDATCHSAMEPFNGHEGGFGHLNWRVNAMVRVRTLLSLPSSQLVYLDKRLLRLSYSALS